MSEKPPTDRDFEKLHPELRRRLLEAFQYWGRKKLAVFVTEGWRSHELQQWYYDSGRTREGPTLTYAQPGESYHNLEILGVPFAGAVDVAVWNEDKPWAKSLEWNGTAAEWDIVHEGALLAGLQILKFEAPHLQLPYPLDVLRNTHPWDFPRPHSSLRTQE